MTSPLAEKISLRLEDGRADKQWAGVRRRAAWHVRVRRASRAALALGALCAVLFAVVRLSPHLAREGVTLAGTTVESEAGGETLGLPDGSRLVLEPASKVTLTTIRPDVVRWTVERGGVDFDVATLPGRRVVVVTNGWEVSVLGTRFVVRARTPSRGAEVRVERGRVSVGRVGEEPSRVLEAGEVWSEGNLAGPPTSSTALAPAETGSAPAAPLAPPASPALPTDPAGSAMAREVAAPAAPPPTASELLARAEAARAANRPREAASALEALRAQYPGDRRAALASFELGRIRLDALHDPRGAAAALTDAIRLAPKAPFREDAEARLVEAYEASGDRDRCEAARAAFLEQHPGSFHRATVASRCPRR